MPSYAPTFTPRSKIRYHAAGIDHTIIFRGPRGATGAAMNSEFKALAFFIFNAAAAQLADDFVWISHDIALTDEDTFAPAEVPATVTGTNDATTFTPIQKITAITFSGRAPGSRARVTMFGIHWGVDLAGNAANNGVVLPAEVAFVGTIATELSGHAKAGSGVAATFYQRGTTKANDRLLKLVRRGLIG